MTFIPKLSRTGGDIEIGVNSRYVAAPKPEYYDLYRSQGGDYDFKDNYVASVRVEYYLKPQIENAALYIYSEYSKNNAEYIAPYDCDTEFDIMHSNIQKIYAGLGCVGSTSIFKDFSFSTGAELNFGYISGEETIYYRSSKSGEKYSGNGFAWNLALEVGVTYDKFSIEANWATANETHLNRWNGNFNSIGRGLLDSYSLELQYNDKKFGASLGLQYDANFNQSYDVKLKLYNFQVEAIYRPYDYMKGLGIRYSI